jgi:carbonic anhydrase
MNAIKSEMVHANGEYVQHFGNKGQLAMPPSRHAAILTCMDARLDPAKFAGFSEGELHVIRNAGGRASDDAIRSLIISHKLLGTTQWFVIHHTNCGMETFTNEVISSLLEKSLNSARLDNGVWKNNDEGNGSGEGKFIQWLTIVNQKESVIEDVKRIRLHPLVSPKISISGFIYDVKSGKLIEVIEATEIGRSKDG